MTNSRKEYQENHINEINNHGRLHHTIMPKHNSQHIHAS